MHKHGSLCWVGRDRQELLELRIAGTPPCPNGNIHPLHPKPFGELTFLIHCLRVMSQIDDGFNTQRGQLPNTLGRWLRTAVETFVDLNEMRQWLTHAAWLEHRASFKHHERTPDDSRWNPTPKHVFPDLIAR